jgi:hypothetical protein
MFSENDNVPISCRLSSRDISFEFSTHARRLGHSLNLWRTSPQKLHFGRSGHSLTKCVNFLQK